MKGTFDVLLDCKTILIANVVKSSRLSISYKCSLKSDPSAGTSFLIVANIQPLSINCKLESGPNTL